MQKRNNGCARYATAAGAGVALALVLVGCGRSEAPRPAVSGAAVSGEETREAVPSLRAAVVPDAVRVVAVDRFVRAPREHVGRVALHGVVVQAFEAQGAFVMVDTAEFQSCGFEACTDAALPVRFEPAAFEGTLPQPGQTVTLLGDSEPLERGFRFDLAEVHREGQVILARRVSPAGVADEAPDGTSAVVAE